MARVGDFKFGQMYTAANTDSMVVNYPCGHQITIPNAAIHAAGGIATAAPRMCPSCGKSQMTERWVAQHTIPAVSEGMEIGPGAMYPVDRPYDMRYAAASVSKNISYTQILPSARDWLEGELNKVTRRAYA